MKKDKISRNPICYRCWSPGHLRSNCPKGPHGGRTPALVVDTDARTKRVPEAAAAATVVTLAKGAVSTKINA